MGGPVPCEQANCRFDIAGQAQGGFEKRRTQNATDQNSGTETQQKMPMFRASADTLLLIPRWEEVCGANTQGAREAGSKPSAFAVLEAGGNPMPSMPPRVGGLSPRLPWGHPTSQCLGQSPAAR